jgi:capsular exopolysaccharide synthesis family protein
MSRIHEALKKAVEEKVSHVSVGQSPELAAIAASIPAPAISARQVAEQTARDKPPSSETGPFLRFDDLVKRCAHPKWKPDTRFSLFHRTDDNAKIGTERFRTMRSRLYQIAAAKTLRKVLVTSSIPDEGKTFVAANLAQSIVHQPDRRVLLIDADLRAPLLHVTLGAPTSPGLTDYLRGEANEYDVIQHSPEVNLCFIPCGRPVSNPSELLSGNRMKKLLDLVTPVFDWVILDSPPALAIHDASILADLCDGVLFVVKAGETNHAVAEKAASEFRSKNLLGVVLNRVEQAGGYEDYYYGSLGEEEQPVLHAS